MREIAFNPNKDKKKNLICRICPDEFMVRFSKTKVLLSFTKLIFGMTRR